MTPSHVITYFGVGPWRGAGTDSMLDEKIEYQSQLAEELGLEYLWVDADAALVVTGQGWSS